MWGQRFGSHKIDPASVAMLVRGAQQLTEQLEDQPLLKAGLLAAIGRAQIGTGAFEQAAPLLEQAMTIRRRELPALDPQIADNAEQLAHVYLFEARTAEAERLVRECIEIRRVRLPESDEAVITAKVGLAVILGMTADAVVEAERLWREVLSARRKSLDANDLRVAEALMGLAGTVMWGPEVGSVSRPLESLNLLEQAIAILHAHPQAADLGLALNWGQRGLVFRRFGNYQQAVNAFKKSRDLLYQSLGKDHVVTIYALHGMAQGLSDAGMRQELRTCYAEILTFYEQRAVPFVPAHLAWSTLRNITTVYQDEGELDKLEQILGRVIARQKALTGYRSQNDTFIIAQLVAILRDRGKTQEANALIEDYFTTLNLAKNLDLIGNLRQRDTIVELLRSVGRGEDAKSVAERSFATVRSRRDP